MFEAHRMDEEIFKILDERTGEILPLEKFFQYSMRRTGEIIPTKNVARAFLSYLKAFEKKEALDQLMPKLTTYAYALQPKEVTPKGLFRDQTLMNFVKRWVNNKKGRTSDVYFIKQGGKIDTALRGVKMFTTIKDLGFNLMASMASFVGEAGINFKMMGHRKYLIGTYRKNIKQGKEILKKYENFIGKSIWEELGEASNDIGDKFIKTLFAGFRESSRAANKTFLLGMISPAEFKSGEISIEKLADLKRIMGRSRVTEGSKSIVGSTSWGAGATQYKTWAIPLIKSNIDNLTAVSKKIMKLQGKDLLKSQEFWELIRTAELTAGVLLVVSMWGDEEDDSFIGKLKTRSLQEAMSVITAMDPDAKKLEIRI
jgi:hypothetical protein